MEIKDILVSLNSYSQLTRCGLAVKQEGNVFQLVEASTQLVLREYSDTRELEEQVIDLVKAINNLKDISEFISVAKIVPSNKAAVATYTMEAHGNKYPVDNAPNYTTVKYYGHTYSVSYRNFSEDCRIMYNDILVYEGKYNKNNKEEIK